MHLDSTILLIPDSAQTTREKIVKQKEKRKRDYVAVFFASTADQ
jgi:hypothetical protein